MIILDCKTVRINFSVSFSSKRCNLHMYQSFTGTYLYTIWRVCRKHLESYVIGGAFCADSRRGVLYCAEGVTLDAI